MKLETGRSEYNITINTDVNTIEQIIQKFLSERKFSLIEDGGEKFYRAGSVLSGYKYFNYRINGNMLTIYAWLKGGFGEIKIEQTGMMNTSEGIIEYRNMLMTLFSTIEVANGPSANFDSQTGKPLNNGNQAIEEFKKSNLKSNETACEIGFWLSIIGIFLIFLGGSYGLIIYATNLILGIQGLKTKKKVKAIVTLVITVISILYVLITFKTMG